MVYDHPGTDASTGMQRETWLNNSIYIRLESNSPILMQANNINYYKKKRCVVVCQDACFLMDPYTATKTNKQKCEYYMGRAQQQHTIPTFLGNKCPRSATAKKTFLGKKYPIITGTKEVTESN